MKKIPIIILFFLIWNYSFSQFKVVGYVPVSMYFPAKFELIQFSKITHLNLAFINPDSSGNFPVPVGLDTLVTVAHQNKIKVLASFGGGNAPVYIRNMLSDMNRSRLIDSMVNFVMVHQLDGEDVDLEGEMVDNNYAGFVNDLGIKLRKNKKLMTAAVATYFGAKIATNTLSKFDFLNIMSYDYTGPWTPKEPGPHAAFSMAVEELNYWTKTRGVQKNKVILGVPFYGYRFGKDIINEFAYKTIIAENNGAEMGDSAILKDSAVIYYNGLTTIRKKVDLALQKAGGVMIWQLYQDSSGESSLLNAIEGEIKKHHK